PNGKGKICSRGHSSIKALYDPDRLKYPLKRTNPEKGIGVDPKWVRISWDEALKTVVEQLDKVRRDDPRKLVIATFDQEQGTAPLFGPAFGTPNNNWGVYFCGNYLHSSMYLTNGTFHCDFDTRHCQYLMLFGNQAGFGAGLNPNITAQNVAEARKRGMRVVVVDPFCNNSASKADEWVPLRPGTDGALVLAMMNVLLNELKIYDKEFLGLHTNAPYLVKNDGYYLRRDGKPLVWDLQQGKAQAFDAPVRQYALEGKYTVDGVEVTPALEVLREHLKKYTPEYASGITTVPADTIRRLTAEFGRAASIGSVIEIDGKSYPLRPVAANIYRGTGAHEHGVAVALALQTLNMLVGAFYAVGGHRGLNLIGPNWSWQPGQYDGLVVPPGKLTHFGKTYYGFKVKPSEVANLRDLYPIATGVSPNYLKSILDPAKHGLPYEPEVLLVSKRNLFLGGVKKEVTAQALKKFKFIAFFGAQLDEVAEFADIALPDVHWLEKHQVFPHTYIWSNNAQTGHWVWGLRQPVAEPVGEARDWIEVLEDIADRMGFLGKLYELYNNEYGLTGQYRLDPPRKYTKEEFFNLRIKNELGEDKDLKWLRDHGYYTRKRLPEEDFPLDRLSARFPIYYENIKQAGEMVREVTGKMGIEWDTEDYTPLPVWRPCHAFKQNNEYDLFAINFRVATHTQTFSAQNPWLHEVARLNPYAMKVIMNTQAARKRGISDGDRVWVQSESGKMVRQVKVTECIHPEVVAISSHFGGWAKTKPVAARLGDNFNCLLPFGQKHQDPVSAGLDACVKVKVSKI
ncbi:MAG: molybdopterin-dependent oxidoreductase, partial [Chloroflexi bacterium]|nr:molybdopterin-dependent oxidoreductase [Chloroflexota bacterium]